MFSENVKTFCDFPARETFFDKGHQILNIEINVRPLKIAPAFSEIVVEIIQNNYLDVIHILKVEKRPRHVIRQGPY